MAPDVPELLQNLLHHIILLYNAQNSTQAQTALRGALMLGPCPHTARRRRHCKEKYTTSRIRSRKCSQLLQFTKSSNTAANKYFPNCVHEFPRCVEFSNFLQRSSFLIKFRFKFEKRGLLLDANLLKNCTKVWHKILRKLQLIVSLRHFYIFDDGIDQIEHRELQICAHLW